MSVKFDVVFKNYTREFEEAICFGRLKAFKEIVQWENGGRWGAMQQVCYYPEYLTKKKDALRWYAYLNEHAMWSQALAEVTEPKDIILSDVGIKVRVDINPHFMINTLSMYRHPQTHPNQVELWCMLVDAGCNPDAAAYAAMLLMTDDGKVKRWGYEDNEHTVVSRRCADVESLVRYVQECSGQGFIPPYYDGTEDYSINMVYHRGDENGVAFWLSGYRACAQSGRLEDMLLPSTLSIVYDKEKKEVVSSSKEAKPVDIKTELPLLIERIHELAGVA